LALVCLLAIAGIAVGLASLRYVADDSTGHVDLVVSDGPSEASGVSGLQATVTSARILSTDASGAEVVVAERPLGDAVVDLSRPTKGARIIGDFELKGGRYAGIELRVSKVTATMNGEPVEVTVPDGVLRLDQAFTVPDGGSVQVDFGTVMQFKDSTHTLDLFPVVSRTSGHHGDGGHHEGKKGNLRGRMEGSKDGITGFDSLNVTFSKARIYTIGNNSTEENYTEASLDNVTVDLTQLGENATTIANLTLEPGNYSKVELFVSNVSGVVDGKNVTVKVPSGKLVIEGPFEIVANETTEFVFHIHVVKLGHKDVYNLLPVISKAERDDDEDDHDGNDDNETCENVFDQFDHLNVTVTKVVAYTPSDRCGGANYTETALDNVTVDLTQLGTNLTSLFNLTLPAGDYTKLVFYVSNITGVVNGTAVNISLSGGKIFIAGRFEVGSNGTVLIDPRVVVVTCDESGNYVLQPLIGKPYERGEGNDDDEDEGSDHEDENDDDGGEHGNNGGSNGGEHKGGGR